jgi:hypothetical protein
MYIAALTWARSCAAGDAAEREDHEQSGIRGERRSIPRGVPASVQRIEGTHYATSE